MASYQELSTTLTLSGTNADGIYTPSSANIQGYGQQQALLVNAFSTASAPYDDLDGSIEVNISGKEYYVSYSLFLRQSFWSDNENPASPKLLSQDDIELASINIMLLPNLTGEIDTCYVTNDVTVVPLPPTVLLFGSGLLGLVGWRRFRNG